MRLATLLIIVALGSATVALGADRGMVTESQFGFNRVAVIDSGIPAIVGIVPFETGVYLNECVVSPDGTLGLVTDPIHGLWVLDLSVSPPRLAPGTNPIPVSATALNLASTSDGRFAVVCESFSGNTISVVDVDERFERSTFDLEHDCAGIDVCRDGSVLVSSLYTGIVRRLVIDTAGNLIDTHEQASFGFPGTVKCSPDGRSGVVFASVGPYNFKLTSFRTSGMTAVSERTLPTPGVTGTFARNGSMFVARTANGIVEAYAYDLSTAVLGEAPIYSLELMSGGATGIAVDPSGTKLYVPIHFGLRIVDAATGVDDPFIYEEQLLYPAGICFPPAGGEACTAGDACDDLNPCTDDACDEGTGFCAHGPNDSSTCDDGNACTGLDRCQGGLCISDPVTCSDPCGGGCCTIRVCDPATGGCIEAPKDCDDHNPCTDDSCGAYGECVHAPSPAYTNCDNHNACDGYYDYCDGYGYCLSDPLQCEDFTQCTIDGCDPAIGCTNFGAPLGTFCDPDGNPCNGQLVCDQTLTCAPVPPLDCDDGNPCTSDACLPNIGCVHTDEPEFTPCEDGLMCNGHEYCHLGAVCYADVPYICFPTFNPCVFEFCDEQTGCYAYVQPAGTPCSDGNPCTVGEVCDGVYACLPGAPVQCAALDQCHAAGVCDPASGVCSNPVKPDGTTCNDSDPCTAGETCMAGACTPASTGLNEPNPRTNGYYKRLCHGPHSGDDLSDADAACVASVAHTFAGLTTVFDICAELTPSDPNNDACDRTDDDLMVLALNICRGRVCSAQSIDSQCGGNANVGQSLEESDAILGDASRDPRTCAHAKCLDEEINTGRALKLNSLVVSREGSAIRLDWHPPYLDDGTGHPTKYHVWRRTQGSLAPFVQIGITNDPTFLDTSAGIGAYQYEVTAVMN